MILKNKNHFIVSILITLFLACSLQGIFATDTTISHTDETGIKGGIDATSTGGTLTLQPGTYNKTNKDTNISISKNLTIKGNGSTGTVKIDANKKSRIFTIANNVKVTFINITFMNGNADYGGAIYNQGSVVVYGSSFTENTATSIYYGGGAIYNKGTLTVFNSVFTNNIAKIGGAIEYTGKCTIGNSVFTNNTATNHGGAIYIFSGNGTVFNSVFTNNTANHGGAISSYGNFNVSNSTFTNNTATYEGGAIYNSGSNCIVDNSNFTRNTATNHGGAIYNNDHKCTIGNSVFTNNTAKNNGGAIYNKGTLTVFNSVFTNNTANIGGAIYSSNENVILLGCEFINNTEKKVTTDTTITTNFKGQNATISGVLTNENKKPIANAKLTVNINGEKYTVKTDADGSWTIQYPYTLNVGDILKVTVSWEGNDNYMGFNKTVGFVYF